MAEYTSSDGVQLRGPVLQSLVVQPLTAGTLYVEYVDKNGYTCATSGQAEVAVASTAAVRVSAALAPPAEAAGVIVSCSEAFNWNQAGAVTGTGNAINTTGTVSVAPNGSRGTVAASVGLHFGPGATGRTA